MMHTSQITTSESAPVMLERSQRYVLENYGRLPLVMVRGAGAELFDATGKRYIDLFAGFGAGGLLGHCHPEVVSALQRQSEKLLSHGNLFANEPQALLAERLVQEHSGAKVFFCHSGAEAAEAAIKLARKVDARRYKIICFENCFHGRTMGALSLCPESFQVGFEPMLPGALRAPFGDLEAVAALMDDETAAVFIEPLQGEGGMNLSSQAFLQGLRRLCSERNILLVCDEVWSAPGRTGRFFAWQHFDILPDITTMAKALGGGLPLAACIIDGKWTEVLGPGTHGCTMGGNPLCTAAGLAALQVVDRDKLIPRAERLGGLVGEFFKDAALSVCKDIRGAGLMIGIELDESVEAKECMLRCIDAGVAVGAAKRNVLRFAPPMNIPEPLLLEALETVATILRRF